MTIYLGLGANDGDRRQNLERAIVALQEAGFRLDKISPLVESPALLSRHAEPTWHKPYLNLAVSGVADWQPQQGLAIAKRIEQDLGRTAGARWSPRPIDIDFLHWRDCPTTSERLTIPHADAYQRDFVLTPLLHLQPDLAIGQQGESVFALTHAIRPIPLWMAVLNVTPDSFSDGGEWSEANQLDAYLDKLIERNVQIIDLGAESTRPAAAPLDCQQEWARLEPVLQKIAERLHGKHIKPWLSVDSRHPTTMDKAMRYGVDMINDVGGLGDADMVAVAKNSGCQVVAMHSLKVPLNPAVSLPTQRSACSQITQWAEQKMETWARAGLDLNRMILDPGIGFGKSSLQAFELLSHCHALRQSGLRLLIGHSRKSFMSGMTARPPHQRDLETLGMSLALCQQGVDIIRVHAPLLHMRAYLAWAHVTAAAQSDNDKREF